MAITDPLSDTGLVAWCTLQRAYARLGGLLSRELYTATGLSEADYQILEALHRVGGRLRAVELREQLGWEKSRLSHQARRMEQRGLLERTECALESRGTDLALTDDGRRAAIDAIDVRADSVGTHVISPLDRAQLRQLTEICDQLHAHTAETANHSP
jgi:DNA-binding MarR family transcriptional regulator